MTKWNAPRQPRYRPYTVVSRMNEEGSFPKVEWIATKGFKVEQSAFCKGALTATHVMAIGSDEAILQAKKKQGLEALLKRIAKHKETENVTDKTS